jgi:hypothetical protein
MADVPKPTEGSSASRSDCLALAEAKGKLVEVSKPKVTMEQQKAETTEVPKRPIETRAKTAEEPESKKSAEQPKILSPPQETELPKVSEIPEVTPKRRRMASVLDAIMESTKVLLLLQKYLTWVKRIRRELPKLTWVRLELKLGSEFP